jgi:hypothetical protein
MNWFVKFMVAPAGRITRAAAGAAIIAAGLIGVTGTLGDVIAALGVVPLVAGVFDICVFAPIFRLPWAGARIRRME